MNHERAIKEFVVREFLPGVPVEELQADYDLVQGGVIDSLGLLKVISWIEQRFGIAADDLALDPDHFRSVAAIDAVIDQATDQIEVT